MNDQDKQFLQEMYGCGMAEIEGGHMAQQCSKDAAVKSFGQRMIHDHTQADQELRTLAQKLGVQLENRIEQQAQQKLDQVHMLTGSEFDREYILYQVHEHEQDVQKAEQQARQTQDKDVRQCAEMLASMFQAHLDLARQTLETLQQQPARAW